MSTADDQASTGQPTAQYVYMPPANLPTPKPLVMDGNLATNWKAWKTAWSRYEIATGISNQSALVRASTLLSVIGEDATKVFETFQWGTEEHEEDASHVIAKFDAYCEPRTQVIYERYRFNNRKQEPGENIASYVTELRTIAKNCNHAAITSDEILRDRIVLGIRDDKIRERLLGFNDLSLQKAIDIVKAAQQTEQQVKSMRGDEISKVNALRDSFKEKSLTDKRPRNDTREQEQKTECGNCGRHHRKRECPAFGQRCRKCGKKNHFQAQCRSKNRNVANLEEESEDDEDVYQISSIGEETNRRASKTMVTLNVNKKSSEHAIRF